MQFETLISASFHTIVKQIAFVALFTMNSSVIAQTSLLTGMKISVDQFEVTGENPLSTHATYTILDHYLGEHEGIEGIEAAASELENKLKQAGFNFSRVTVPAQTLKSGVIRLHIANLPIGKIDVSGNQNFSKNNILRSIPSLQIGKTSELSKMNKAVDLANRSPAKKTTLSFVTNEMGSKINARLEVKDKKTIELLLLANNVGSDETGKYRTGLKFKHHNLFGLDHGLALTYKASPTKLNDVDQYGINYRIPLYRLGDELNFTAWDSKSNVANTSDDYLLKGAGKFYAARYTHFLAKSTRYQHQVNISLQDKLSISQLTLDDADSNSDVRSRPLEIKYKSYASSKNTDTDFFLGYKKNLSGGSKNNDSAYALARAGAEQDWSAITLGLNIDYWLPKQWRLRSSIEGQYSSDPLISGEQFGFGGSSSLPGFKEWEVLGDKGYQTKLELRTPRFNNNTYLFTSYESGAVKRLVTSSGEADSETASSFGIGASSRVGKRCDIKLQAGYVLDGVDDTFAGVDRTQDGDSRVHFDLLCGLL